LLDVSRQGDLIDPVIGASTERNVPYVLAIGYDRTSLPSRYSDVPLRQKPIDTRCVASLLFDRDAAVL